MSNVITQQKTRHEQLADAERRIQQASRDTVDSIRIIGHELTRIEEEQLFEVMGRNDFQEYVEVHLRLDYRMARAWMRASDALAILDEQKLQLPYNQSQVLELSKLTKPEILVGVWQKILDFCDRENRQLTFDVVRTAVEAQRKKANQFRTRARFKAPEPVKKGIDIDLSDVNGAEEIKKSPWSEDGERALNRIRRLCGNDIADAINEGNPKVPEKDLLKWAEQEAESVKTLAYWIVIKGWTLRKALAYDEAIDAGTTVEKLIDLARSRGGRVNVQFEDARITIEITE
jgi:hypothetical protein